MVLESTVELGSNSQCRGDPGFGQGTNPSNSTGATAGPALDVVTLPPHLTRVSDESRCHGRELSNRRVGRAAGADTSNGGGAVAAVSIGSSASPSTRLILAGI
jgi:hypothetical protein